MPPYHSVFFSHGGGPLPLLGEPSHKAMVEFMKALPEKTIKPDQILLISAHWEERVPTLLGSPHPPMFYDYYGFPDEAYEINYPATGSPELATRVAAMLSRNNIPSHIDAQRGFDHGLFIPLKLMYPQADIPAIQLSLFHSLDPEAHLALGETLRELANENILVIGSGFSFHNLRAFDWYGKKHADPLNDSFQDWLIENTVDSESYVQTRQALKNWEKAPAARYCFPREEHLLPLFVCAGMMQRRAEVAFDDFILGKRSIALGW